MKKKILFVHHVAAIGGGSYCMLNLVRSLNRNDYEPYVLLGEDGPLVEEFRKIGVPVDILSGMQPLPYNKSLWRRSCLQRYAAQSRSNSLFERYLAGHPEFDIVYLNNMLLCPYLRIARIQGREAVVHVREHWSRGEHPFQFLFIRNTINKWADAVIAINRYSASRIAASDSKTHVVYDWIDMSDRFEPMPFESVFGCDVSGLKVYLYAGGFNPIKGIHELVSSFHKLEGKDLRLLILGKRPEQGMTRKMMRTCAIIDSDSRIKCIPSCYKISHLIEQAYCTVSYFTIPHANLFLAESLICKTPAIAAGTEEAYEYSDGGRLAALFPFKSRKAFDSALRMSDAEYDALKKRVSASSQTISTQFDKQRNTALWHEAMRTI